jgi:hypothetical protein
MIRRQYVDLIRCIKIARTLEAILWKRGETKEFGSYHPIWSIRKAGLAIPKGKEEKIIRI